MHPFDLGVVRADVFKSVNVKFLFQNKVNSFTPFALFSNCSGSPNGAKAEAYSVNESIKCKNEPN